MTMSRSSGNHLLTVLHAAEPTGPPMLALHFLRWLHDYHPQWATSTLLIDGGGSMLEQFSELGQVIVAGPDFPFGPGNSFIHRRLTNRRLDVVRKRIRQLGPVDVCHVHCAGSMRVVPALPEAPLLCHIHEMAVGLERDLGPLARTYLTSADRYIVVSEASRKALMSRFSIDPALVTRHHGFVVPSADDAVIQRSELGLSEGSFVVAGSGVRHWRKAPELFVRTALAARRRWPDVDWRFVWIGGYDSGDLEALVLSANLDGLVRFVPHEPDPRRWFVASDAFFLSAREDAFPLVCVEAAHAGCPIITFDNGGIAELIGESGGGSVVRFPDVEAAADALGAIATDDAMLLRYSRCAREYVESQLTVNRLGPAMLSTVEAVRSLRW